MSDEFTTPERFRAELRDALLAHPATSPRRQPAGARRRPFTIRVGLALAGTGTAAVVALSSGGELRPQAATAASVLRSSANALDRNAPSLALGPHQYLYTRTSIWFRYANSAPRPFVVHSVSEEWRGRDGRGRSYSHVLSVAGLRNRRNPLAQSSDVRLRASARPFLLSPTPYPPGIAYSYDQLRHLPTNPGQLSVALDRISARNHVSRLYPGRQYETVIRFGVLRGLAESPATAGVRAAVYRVLAATPGIRLLGRRNDSVGRTGTAVAADLGAIELMLIIDPSTGELLQTSRTLRHRSNLMPGEPAGLVNRATFLASAVVDSTRSRPKRRG